MWTNLSPPSVIKRMRINHTVSINMRFIATVDRDASAGSTTTPNSYLFKFSSSRREERPMDFNEIQIVYATISCAVCFLVFLMHFRIHWMHEIKLWSREKEEFTSWTSNFVFGNWEWKAMHPTINWSFRRLIWVRLRVFILIFHHLELILHFES